MITNIVDYQWHQDSALNHGIVLIRIWKIGKIYRIINIVDYQWHQDSALNHGIVLIRIWRICMIAMMKGSESYHGHQYNSLNSGLCLWNYPSPSSSAAMKKIILPILFMLSCSNQQAQQSILKSGKQFSKPKITYQQALSEVSRRKSNSISPSNSKAGIQFSKLIDSLIFPYWYGTPWDFNGVTETPNEGYIACGYFVTTVLRDAGVKINRVKMAQCASEQMIKSLTTDIEHYPNMSFDSFIAKVKKHGVGISVIGLDNHTGFLYNDGMELYFIHSSFVGTGRVIKEVASINSILINSRYKVVGYISEDQNFIERWQQHR